MMRLVMPLQAKPPKVKSRDVKAKLQFAAANRFLDGPKDGLVAVLEGLTLSSFAVSLGLSLSFPFGMAPGFVRQPFNLLRNQTEQLPNPHWCLTHQIFAAIVISGS
jgi:hypothetical protein